MMAELADSTNIAQESSVVTQKNVVLIEFTRHSRITHLHGPQARL
jgi:hypothetical protein